MIATQFVEERIQGGPLALENAASALGCVLGLASVGVEGHAHDDCTVSIVTPEGGASTTEQSIYQLSTHEPILQLCEADSVEVTRGGARMDTSRTFNSPRTSDLGSSRAKRGSNGASLRIAEVRDRRVWSAYQLRRGISGSEKAIEKCRAVMQCDCRQGGAIPPLGSIPTNEAQQERLQGLYRLRIAEIHGGRIQ